MNLKQLAPILILMYGCSPGISMAKTPFNTAVEECVSQTRLGDGHTNQDISRCTSKADGVCGEPSEFQSPFGEKLGYDFVKTSLLRCTKTVGMHHEVCDINIWIKLISANASGAENAHPREEGEFKVQCLKLPIGEQHGTFSSFYEVK